MRRKPRDFSLPRFFFVALVAVPAIAIMLIWFFDRAFPDLARVIGLLSAVPFSGATYALTALWEGSLFVYAIRRTDLGELARELEPFRALPKTLVEIAGTSAILVALALGWAIVLPAMLRAITPALGRAALRDMDGLFVRDRRILSVAVSFFALVIVAPITEELVFRRTLPRVFRRHVSAPTAVIISSVLFGLGHGLARAPEMAVFGLILCLAYLHRRSFLYIVAIHAGNNIVALFGEPLVHPGNWGLPIGILLLLVGAAFGVALIRKEWRYVSRLQALPRVVPVPKRITQPQPEFLDSIEGEAR